MSTECLYPLRLEASLHETLWGGHRLGDDGWKQVSQDSVAIGEAWETEVTTVVQNGCYAGKTLGTVVDTLGSALLGEQAIAIFGQRFPLLAKFIDANAQLSVQVHPNDHYAAVHEGGKPGKSEFWYILAATPGATIVHGFKTATSRAIVEQAIADSTLHCLLYEEPVKVGDVIYVPAGTVHAIGSGVLLYELQEYSDVTYRMYDYGRLAASGKPRELHIERSLAVAHYDTSRQIKMRPVLIERGPRYEDHCLVACQYFVTRKLQLEQQGHTPGKIHGRTGESCIILSSLGTQACIYYGTGLHRYESLTRGQTIILPAALGDYRIEGDGALLCSYVPAETDTAWQLWRNENRECNS